MYMVLFRSPADREQMRRVGQRMYPNHNDLFMQIYREEIEKPYGHILVDNKPETAAGRQVVSNVFGNTLRYDIGLKANTDLKAEEHVDTAIQEPTSSASTSQTPMHDVSILKNPISSNSIQNHKQSEWIKKPLPPPPTCQTPTPSSNSIQNHKQSEWYEMSKDLSMNKDASSINSIQNRKKSEGMNNEQIVIAQPLSHGHGFGGQARCPGMIHIARRDEGRANEWQEMNNATMRDKY